MRDKRFALGGILSLLLGTIFFLTPTSASARRATTYTQTALSATVTNSSVTASVTIKASTATKVAEAGVCVRDSANNPVDFALTQSPTISTSGTTFTATKTFSDGTYVYFGCVRTGTSTWHTFATKQFTVFTTQPPANRLFTGDFETGDLSGWGIQQCAPGRISVYSAASQPTYPAPEQGTYASRFHVLSSDVSPCTPTNNPRAQMDTTSFLAPGNEYWETFSIYFPASFPDVPPGGWYLFQEDYGDPYNGSPALGFDVDNGGGVPIFTLSRGAQYGYDVIWKAPFVRGQWLRFVVHKKMAKDSSGFVEFWLNGTQQTFTDGSLRKSTQTMHSDATGNYQFYINSYAQAGMFSASSWDTYFDDVRIGTTRTDVDP